MIGLYSLAFCHWVEPYDQIWPASGDMHHFQTEASTRFAMYLFFVTATGSDLDSDQLGDRHENDTAKFRAQVV